MKKFVTFVMAVVMCISLGLPALASGVEAVSNQSAEEVVVTRAEETKWYYRYFNGRQQRRLWSITREIWLTEWEYF